MTQSAGKKFFKVVIVGEAIVGKTTLRLRYLGQGFRKEYLSTLGADFAIKDYKNNQIQIWDLAGQKSFKAIIKSYFVGAHGMIVVFDVTRRETMAMVVNWIDEFISNNGELVPTIVVGNKIDLRGMSDDIINNQTAIDFVNHISEKYNYQFDYVETSALTGQNIENAFGNLIDRIESLIKLN